VRFLADESCDFTVVKALRNAGHDITSIAEINPGVDDEVVLALALSEARVLLTEDKDFGLLAYAGGRETAGVVLIGQRRKSRCGLDALVNKSRRVNGMHAHMAPTRNSARFRCFASANG